ncbi:glycosyltransferase family 2 protein [Paenibacillus sp. N1-5-1-14]|uniref:glycosyltransferase family 2 protein n=1 Tax=Paenibacillus radicibacter TaxID=2972488 RepID=UPI002158F877|nr:glycosyltransferase family 2 protein [Paenibacillus radicibacter]MCR8643565.1 glycosyltransferase family 2 protein [Paenibacillus radicibacter]
MEHPLISIVIPTFNRQRELGELLESIVRQRYTPLEVIIVNDCGDSIEWVNSLYPELHIQIMNMDHNVQHVRARNEGVLLAQGEYILLCDDDDLLTDGHIDRMLKALEGGYDLAYSDVEIVHYVQGKKARMPVTRQLFAYDDNLTAMRQFSTFVPSGCLYRKAIHQEIGGFDAAVYHYWDWDFYLRVAAKFSVVRVPVASVLYAFQQGGDNLSDQLDHMRPYLNLLSQKHDLGFLPTKNFFLLLEEPAVKCRRVSSTLVWNGLPYESRLTTMGE